MTTRNPAGTTRSRVTLAAITVAAVALLGACTNDTDDPTPTGSGSSSATASSTPSAFVPSDQSALVLAATPPAVAGSVKGLAHNTPATFNVAQVRATPRGTVLTYWFTAPDSSALIDHGDHSWENQPTLVDPTAKKVYQPSTFTDSRGETRCLCTDGSYILAVPQPRTVYYPALPEGVTTIEVRQEGFDKPVTLTVTR